VTATWKQSSSDGLDLQADYAASLISSNQKGGTKTVRMVAGLCNQSVFAFKSLPQTLHPSEFVSQWRFENVASKDSA
jgi:hypothetical protein